MSDWLSIILRSQNHSNYIHISHLGMAMLYLLMV